MKRRIALLVVLASAFLIGWQTPVSAGNPHSVTGDLTYLGPNPVVDGTIITFTDVIHTVPGAAEAFELLVCVSTADGTEVQRTTASSPIPMFVLVTGVEAVCHGELWQTFKPQKKMAPVLLDITEGFLVIEQ